MKTKPALTDPVYARIARLIDIDHIEPAFAAHITVRCLHRLGHSFKKLGAMKPRRLTYEESLQLEDSDFEVPEGRRFRSWRKL